MASLLSGLGSAGSAVGSGIGAAAKSANAFMGSDIGGMTGAATLPAGVQGPVQAGVGATGINWADILKAAQSGGNAKGMTPLLQGKQKDGDLDDILSIVSIFFGGI